ncbi:MAG: hypothetical protein KF749_01500 [Bacteroidetes bacterium]|nr:hypothetical protein [Bacteroidota bacterium]MCW5896189.1 hypothetical protein [Bacteroidota bacterium]
MTGRKHVYIITQAIVLPDFGRCAEAGRSPALQRVARFPESPLAQVQPKRGGILQPGTKSSEFIITEVHTTLKGLDIISGISPFQGDVGFSYFLAWDFVPSCSI